MDEDRIQHKLLNAAPVRTQSRLEDVWLRASLVLALGFACCNKADSCLLVAVVSYLPECTAHSLQHLLCTIKHILYCRQHPLCTITHILYCRQHLLCTVTHICILPATPTLRHHTHFHTACNTYSAPSHTFSYCLQHLLCTITHIFILFATPTLHHHTGFYNAVSMSFTER